MQEIVQLFLIGGYYGLELVLVKQDLNLTLVFFP